MKSQGNQYQEIKVKDTNLGTNSFIYDEVHLLYHKAHGFVNCGIVSFFDYGIVLLQGYV